MDRIAVLLILFFCYTCLGAKQTFYLSETGGTSTTCSLDDPCGSLGNIIPLIRNVDPYQVEVNIFPGFYNESSTRITFPDQTLVTLQKYDPNETGETVTFLGIGSSLIFSSSVTITGITFQEYDAFLTMATPTAETNIQISNSNFITISTLLTNIKDATVVLTNISMSTVDKNNIGSLYRRGLFTPPNSLEYPKSFSIIGGTFDNLKYGQYIIDIQCDYFEMVNASFTRSGRMHIRSDNGSIIGTSFVDSDGMEREGGYAGCKCALMLTGHWTLEDSWMGGYTTFTGFIVDVGDLNLTMVNSSPGYFDIFSSIFYADNCEFFGTISAFDIEFVNCKLGSNWVVRPSLTGSGMISNSTVYQYDIFGAISFEDSAVTSSKLQLEPYGYPGSLPTTHVEFTNSNFTNISEGVQIRHLTVNVANSYFSNCYSSDSGGALYVIDGNTQIIDSTFTSNTAASIGGAIFAKSDNNVVMNVNIEGSVFETNTANLGGAIACSGKVTILNSDDATFEGNIATYYQQDPNFYCGTTDAPVTNPDSAASLVWLWILLSILVTVVVLLAIFVVIATIITLVKRYRAKEDFDIEPDRNLPY